MTCLISVLLTTLSTIICLSSCNVCGNFFILNLACFLEYIGYFESSFLNFGLVANLSTNLPALSCTPCSVNITSDP